MHLNTPRQLKVDPREIQALVKELQEVVDKEQERAMAYCVPPSMLQDIFHKAKSLNAAGV